ncbi:hypothetical protein GH714_010035 [Hevea brasiliensis]|uniref:SAM-dependent MTase DRM-type domain-containing protein n=1 Tax=Hevea brasiliensis TaxID=3981 RepID=A0A6A6M6N3_HEVBR|nr:hypothetical protein GH714_010035 [Hevea brasiliensis]
MDGDSFCGGDDNFDWGSEDEREIENYGLSSSSSLTVPGAEATASSAEASSSVGSSGSKLIDHFVGMGFPEKMVAEAIQENGEENTDLILETLLKCSARSSASSSGSKLIDHFIGMGFDAEMVAKAIQENGEGNTDTILETLLTYSATAKSEPKEGNTLVFLSRMGYTVEEASIAMSDVEKGKEFQPEVLGLLMFSLAICRDLFMARIHNFGCESLSLSRPDATIAELTDFICAAQMAKAADASFPEEKPKLKLFDDNYPKHKKRSYYEYDKWKKKQRLRLEKRMLQGDDEMIRLPNPMIGFGVPTDPAIVTRRTLPEAAIGPPYFYYENVALAPKGVWSTISRFLYDVEPEFVDSKYFCAAARKRGYVHNLPIQNRFPLLPLPPHTVHEALPLTKKWWPSWDTRTKLNCLQTCIGSAKLTDRIRKAIEDYEGDPPLSVQKFVLDECRKWNLVWVGRNKVAPLEPDEVEMLLGFPRNHTRGGGISRTDRYKSLGNSFQVDTVAYHLSVLKDLFPGGINLLSLFSGIGGAEVALHRLGIRLKNVVSVEISEVNRNIMRCWWEQTNQTGNLIDIVDVQQLNADRLEQLMSSFGGFDLVIGGILAIILQAATDTTVMGWRVKNPLFSLISVAF